MESTLLAAQTLITALVSAWLTLGVRDDIRHPDINETLTAEVMAMTRMQRDYPDNFARVAYRAVTDKRYHRQVFRWVIGVELVATIVLWAGVGGLAIALVLSSAEISDFARSLAMIGTMMFTAVFAGFLIVGNHFYYWFCHQSAQNTHFQMTLWGTANLILLAQT